MKTFFIRLIVSVSIIVTPTFLVTQEALAQATAGTQDNIVKLVKAGKKISAIKAYRDAYDVGLADAKRAIDKVSDDLKNGKSISLPEPVHALSEESPDAYLQEVDEYIAKGDLQSAAKVYFNANSDKKSMSILEARRKVEERATQKK